jgi:hypothetical protein
MTHQIDELANISTGSILAMYIDKLKAWISFKMDPAYRKNFSAQGYIDALNDMDLLVTSFRSYFLIRKDSDPGILAMAEQKALTNKVNEHKLSNDQVNFILSCMIKQAQSSSMEFQKLSRAN